MASEQARSPTSASSFVLLHEQDNILVCTRFASAGSLVSIDGIVHRLGTDIELGHKIARASLAAGQQVRRYGVPIGTMIEAVEAAGHVHSHNLKSDYIPAHHRDAAGKQRG